MICHFSCGATSAIATALTLKDYPDAEIVYADTGSEHPDNLRFLKDCEELLFKKRVTVVRSKDFANIFEVFEKRQYLASPSGAPCTSEMKKRPIADYIGERLVTEKQCFGFDAKEAKRIKRYQENNPEVKMHLPLIDHGLSKPNCLALLERFGIDMPVIYSLGYANANCIGCVKAENLRYWAAIREDFPETFEWYAKFERSIGKRLEDGTRKGAAINKKYIKGVRHRLFLDELPMNIKPKRDVDIHCGMMCGEVGDILDAPVEAKEIDIEAFFGMLK